MIDKKTQFIPQEKIIELLNFCYDKAINGIFGEKNCFELADEYLSKYNDLEIAAQKLISMQITKCSTSGFITGLGGLITLPITIPVNITSVIYIQLRMIAALATIGKYNVKDDEVQTLAYLCLVNTSISDICKRTGIEIANKTTTNLLKKLPGTLLTKINQKVGFRLVTKFGEKGVINLVKLIPVTGGVIGASVDFVNTKIIAKKAYKIFIQNTID